MKITLHVEGAPQRLDLALLRDLRHETPQLSRSQLKTWFRDGKIRLVSERGSTEAARILEPGSHSVEIADWDPTRAVAIEAAAAESCFLSLVHEDESLLVLNKESGVPSIPHSPEETRTAVGAALAHFPALAGVGRGGLEPGILHRLDNSTSGLIVFAKTNAAFERLHHTWKRREIRKTYRALCTHARPRDRLRITSPLALPATIDVKLGHDAKSARKMRVGENGIRGKALEAITKILTLVPRGDRVDATVMIETGVMHQIRAHLAHVGLPILGDTLYGGETSERIWLHAWQLEIPLEGGVLKLEASLPEGWAIAHA